MSAGVILEHPVMGALSSLAIVVLLSTGSVAQTPTFQSVAIQPATTGQIGIQFGRGSFIARTSFSIPLDDRCEAVSPGGALRAHGRLHQSPRGRLTLAT